MTTDTTTFRGQITNPAHALQAILGGRAMFTLRSGATGARFTYRLTRAKDSKKGADTVFFANLLTGSNNSEDFSYLGIVVKPSVDTSSPFFRTTAKSFAGKDAPSVKALGWTLGVLAKGTLPAALEVWHEGKCCRCGRPLTDPDSIARGLGPICADKE